MTGDVTVKHVNKRRKYLGIRSGLDLGVTAIIINNYVSGKSIK